MKSQARLLKKIPTAPGVYFFVGKTGKILYIGKATSLRDRVRSYFGKDISFTRGAQIEKMVEKAHAVRIEETDSVLEALLLEGRLIREHKPPYNTKEKDDKSHNCIVITKEDFPRVLLVRKKEILEGGYAGAKLFGPFPQGSALREAMKVIRKIFPFRDSCMPGAKKPCFNRQINLCPGVCTGEITKGEYKKHIARLSLFLSGKKKTLVKSLEKEMRSFAKKQEFERAGKIKRMLHSLLHIQDIALMKRERVSGEGRIEAYDIAHMGGKDIVGVMTVLDGGIPEKGAYRMFKIKQFTDADDTGALDEVLSRRIAHTEWPRPTLIVVDGGIAQKKRAESVLKRFNLSIPVVSVVKDERHKPRDILGERSAIDNRRTSILFANGEAHRFAISFHKKVRGKRFLGK